MGQQHNLEERLKVLKTLPIGMREQLLKLASSLEKKLPELRSKLDVITNSEEIGETQIILTFATKNERDIFLKTMKGL